MGVEPVTDVDAASPDPAVEIFWRPGCPFCSRLRRVLSRHGVEAQWRDIWVDEDARAVVRAANRGNETVPTVRIGGATGRTLTNPSWRELAPLVTPSSASVDAGVPGNRLSRSEIVRVLSWLPMTVLIVLSLVFEAAGHSALSWATDPFAFAAWWLTRPLRS